MLNISQNVPIVPIKKSEYKSFKKITKLHLQRTLALWITGFLFFCVLVSFSPWTQNIQSKGKVTTLRPEQRPQNIPTTIDGRIEQWYVAEGQLIKKGDTIVHLSEVKTDYFDPMLINRTEQQITAQKQSQSAYNSKVEALQQQIDALTKTMQLKTEQNQNKITQAKLKIQSDSINLEVAKTNYSTAKNQFDRQKNLYDKGLKSLTDLESKELKLQATAGKKVSAANKLLDSKNELLNYRIALNNVQNEYNTKIAKARSDRASASSSVFDAEGKVNKLQSQLSNYQERATFYYITAPQDCYITKVLKKGLGEIIKAGNGVVNIMPASYELAVEMYVEPVDMPLVHAGNKVRFTFDGWPAIFFTGWPNSSIGTFGGTVIGLDNVISDNGKYRILVAPDEADAPWPEALRIGSAANCVALLKDVPVWYELWRQLNSFPPDYYEPSDNVSKDVKMKAPLRKVK